MYRITIHCIVGTFCASLVTMTSLHSLQRNCSHHSRVTPIVRVIQFNGTKKKKKKKKKREGKQSAYIFTVYKSKQMSTRKRDLLLILIINVMN